jgi:hypothetical protein
MTVVAVLIAYIDESYDLTDYVGYWMASVIVHERCLDDYWTDLLDAAHSVVPSLPRGTELHGVELFQGHGPFKGVHPLDRIEIQRRGLEVIERHGGTAVLAAHVPGGFDPPPIHDWRMTVLAQLVPQIEQVARDAEEYVVLVCDEEHTTTTQVIEMLHAGKTALGVHGTPILETAMFARSVYSPGVWPADLVAFTERRIELGYGDDRQRRHTLRRLRGLYSSCRLEPAIVTGAPIPDLANDP